MTENVSVGDVMGKSKMDAAKKLAITLGVIVYAAMLAYTGVHNYSLMTAGVREDMLIWALLGVFTLEISGLAFPLALHYWTFATMQKWITLLLYGVDILLLVLNTVLDYSLTAGTATAQMPWLQQYFAFVVPATPIISGVSWTLIFLLDPSHKQRAMTEELKASTRETLARKIEEAARSAEVNGIVMAAAQQMTQEIVRNALGVYAPPMLPATAQGTPTVKQAGEQATDQSNPAPRVVEPVAMTPPGDNHHGDYTSLDLGLE